MSKEKRFKKQNYIFLLIILLIICGYSLFGLTSSLIEKNGVGNNLVYTNSSKVNYYINITPNDFIKSNTLLAEKTYITNLVNNISMTMEYIYDGPTDIPIETEYKVIATIYLFYNEDPMNKNNPMIWDKEYIIKDNTIKKISKKDNKIVETFDIELPIYNDEVTNFNEYFSIPTQAYLEIKMPVTISGNSSKYEINKEYDILAKIPLNETVFKIETQTNNSKKETIILDNSDKKLQKSYLYVLPIFSSLLFILLILNKISNEKIKEKNNYFLNQLKKDYCEIIVETNNMVDISSLKIIKISNFEELMNLSNVLNMPIMLYETTEKAIFYIIMDKILYVYNINLKKKTEL
jgi:hypothetical protein